MYGLAPYLDFASWSGIVERADLSTDQGKSLVDRKAEHLANIIGRQLQVAVVDTTVGSVLNVHATRQRHSFSQTGIFTSEAVLDRQESLEDLHAVLGPDKVATVTVQTGANNLFSIGRVQAALEGLDETLVNISRATSEA